MFDVDDDVCLWSTQRVACWCKHTDDDDEPKMLCNKRLSLVLSWIISPPYKENRLNSTRNYNVGLSVFHHAINTLFSICLQTDNGIYYIYT
jgi:hypothetical protein